MSGRELKHQQILEGYRVTKYTQVIDDPRAKVVNLEEN